MEPTAETLSAGLPTVKCMRCGKDVPVTPEVLSLTALLNRELAKKGLEVMTEASTATCTECKAYLAEAGKKRVQVDLDLDRLWFKRWRAGELALEEVPADVRARHWHHFQDVLDARAAAGVPKSGAATFASQSPGERPCSACERQLPVDDPIHGLYASCELARQPGQEG